jgi:hypothetical protein
MEAPSISPNPTRTMAIPPGSCHGSDPLPFPGRLGADGQHEVLHYALCVIFLPFPFPFFFLFLFLLPSFFLLFPSFLALFIFSFSHFLIDFFNFFISFLMLKLTFLMCRDKHTKSALKEWCREFKLPVSGNVTTLRERLAAFSADRNAWAK